MTLNEKAEFNDVGGFVRKTLGLYRPNGTLLYNLNEHLNTHDMALAHYGIHDSLKAVEKAFDLAIMFDCLGPLDPAARKDLTIETLKQAPIALFVDRLLSLAGPQALPEGNLINRAPERHTFYTTPTSNQPHHFYTGIEQTLDIQWYLGIHFHVSPFTRLSLRDYAITVVSTKRKP